MRRIGALAAGALCLLLASAACTPKFNRRGQVAAQKAPAGLAYPVVDLSVQGGSALAGVTSHYRVTRVAIGGAIQRVSGKTAAGVKAQGGPGAPR